MTWGHVSLEKCLYFSRRGQGRRILSHNTRHMCQRQNYATIPWGEGTQIFGDSTLQVLGVGDVDLVSHDGAEETHLSSSSSSSSCCCHSHSSLESSCCRCCLLLSTITSKSGRGSVPAAAAAAASSRLLLRYVSATRSVPCFSCSPASTV